MTSSVAFASPWNREAAIALESAPDAAASASAAKPSRAPPLTTVSTKAPEEGRAGVAKESFIGVLMRLV